MAKPNTTQRSWSNYVGASPIESRRGTDFYADSALYGVGGEMAVKEPKASRAAAPAPDEEDGLTEWEKLQRKSALARGLRSMKGVSLEGLPSGVGV
jgi:hypothetical protein